LGATWKGVSLTVGFRSHLPSDESVRLPCRRRHHRIRNHMRKTAITEETTPAAAPTPALKAVVCVSGFEVPRICWLVGVAVLVDPVPVVEARFTLESDIAALDVELLEACELKPELVSDAVEVIESVEDVDTVAVADELCAAELDAAVDAVLVCCSPTTPMIVCAVPSETWNVFSPVLQSHIPSALSG
jgi:hypothetical protein